MANTKSSPSIWGELLKFNLYKRNQGRRSRQVTAVVVAVILFFGAWTLSQGPLSDFVRSFYQVTVSYSASEPQGEIEASLDALASKFGGSRAKVEASADQREIEFRFATSSLGSTQPSLQDSVEKQAGEFAEAVRSDLGSSLRVVSPSHQVQSMRGVQLGVPLFVAALGAWICFRMVNVPRFADFLISVEAEIDKVTWASKAELYRATVVVISTMFFLGAVLFSYDVFWQWFFKLIGFLRN